MKIGNDEKLVFSLLKKYPQLTPVQLHVIFTMIANKKRDMNRLLLSLRIKGLLDSKNKPAKNPTIGERDLMVEIDLDRETLEGLQNLDDLIKIGNTAKSILYILSKIKKSSLQFLSEFFDESTRSIYAVLQRLEQKNLVYSYNSKIHHLNTRGRRFSPKYYVITDLGKIIAKTKTTTINHDHLDKLLEKTQGEIDSMHQLFHTTKT